MKTLKNYYRDWRLNPKKFKMVDYVKVPVFTKKQKKQETMVVGKTIDDELIELFKLRDSKLSPKNDFYTYINELWLKNVDELAKYKKTFYVKQDNIRIIQENTAHSLLKVLKLNSNQKKVFDSFKEIKSSHILKHITDLKTSLTEIFSRDNFYELMVFMHKNPLFHTSFPLIWEMNANLKNTQIYCNTLSSCELTFFDFTFYEKIPPSDKKQHEYQMELYKKVEVYINDIFKCLGMDGSYADILDCEKTLSQCFDGTLKEDDNGYNKISLAESQKLGFDWRLFTQLMGFSSTPSWYIVSSTNYLSNVMKLMR